MDRTQIPSYGALQLIAELEAAGVTVNPNGTVTGKPTVEQLAALRADRDAVIAAAKCKIPDKAMLAWLKEMESLEGTVTRDGVTFSAVNAKRFIDAYLFSDLGRWRAGVARFWLAVYEGSWHASEDD